jgi:hypothetical protein
MRFFYLSLWKVHSIPVMFRKKSLISKLWLKYSDKQAYKLYKWNLKNARQAEVSHSFHTEGKLSTPDQLIQEGRKAGYISVSHSGNAGDVIFALPTLKKLHELSGLPVHLYLKLDQPLNMTGFSSHPLGNVMLNQKMAGMLLPLLDAQPYLAKAGVLDGQDILVNMDYFRTGAINLEHSNIARWCSYITGMSPELWQSWLSVEADPSYRNTIVVARSERYRNTTIDYSFLRKYSNLAFVGVEPEYEDMKRAIPELKWVQVASFRELASIIAGCRLFIGNQSFPFSLAEGLKVNRILEVYYHIPNVIPEGPGAHDFFFQGHFEWLVEHLAGQSV